MYGDKFLRQWLWHSLVKLCTKNYENPSIVVKVTAKKSVAPFFWTRCSVSNLPRSSQLSVLHLTVEPFTARDGARYWLRIAYPTCIRHPLGGRPSQIIAMTFGMEKLEWIGYPVVKKIWRYCYSFWQTRQTDRQTPHDGIAHACIASRGRQKERKNKDF